MQRGSLTLVSRKEGPSHTCLISDLHSRGGCQVAEKDCGNRSLWVNLWVRIFALQGFCVRANLEGTLSRMLVSWRKPRRPTRSCSIR
jgi:hypothetical protein